MLLLTVLPADVAAAQGTLDPPVQGPVLAVFDAPTRYGPGHRGVDIGTPRGTAVRASAAGVVTFAGQVVGAIWVTVDHGDVRTTVGPLASVRVAAGQRVVRGSLLGRSATAHGRAAVHWSARRGDRYVDPSSVGRRVASLVPVRVAGRSPRSAAAPRWPRGRVR